MTDKKFKALVVEELPGNVFGRTIQSRTIDQLPEGNVIIKVSYSGLNYKDAMSYSGNKGITRKYPHTPGIDAAGIVEYSGSPEITKGEEVIVTGYDLGMNTDGGFSEYIRVPAQWVVRKPAGLTLKECMIIGTSGFTAASAIHEFLKHGVKPDGHKVLITGASGAVGSMAIQMLARLGYHIIAATGKMQDSEKLKSIGATEVIDRSELQDTSGKGLLSKRWYAALDTVGGNTLTTVLKSTADRGIVTNCGMIESGTLNVSVFPFIIRGVRLVGIASADTPMEQRLNIWKLISETLKPANLEDFSRVITLEEVPGELDKMLQGQQKGKVIVTL